MAISRVSDLPEVENIWQNVGIQIDQLETDDKQFAMSLVEVSYPDEQEYTPGKYTSKAARIETIADFVAKNIPERDEFYNQIKCFSGAVLTGHVGINEGVDVLDTEYGLFAKGYSNTIEATNTNLIVANQLVELQSKNDVTIDAENDIALVALGGVSIQADEEFSVDAANTVIASSVRTIIASGSPDNIQFQVDQLNAESKVPLFAPTPFDNVEQESKQVVNIDYLNNVFYAQLKDELRDEIFELLNQTGGDSQTESNLDVYSISVPKLFELKTFDCQLSVDQDSSRSQNLWLLGSTISSANEKVPKAFNVLYAARNSDSLSEQLPNGKSLSQGQQIQYKLDAYGHKVIFANGDISDILATRSKCIESYGQFWYYVIDGNTLYLPVNNMYFRAGAQNLGKYYKPSLPAVSAIPKLIQNTGTTKLHSASNWSYQAKASNYQPTYANDDKWSYENTSGLVAPPSVQSYTYMVCF